MQKVWPVDLLFFLKKSIMQPPWSVFLDALWKARTGLGVECTLGAQKNPLKQLTNWVDSDALKWVIL